MPSTFPLLLFVTVAAVSFLPTAYAFGAGDVPDFAFLNDKAFRHGDLEATLENLVKFAGGSGGGGGGLLGHAMGLLAAASGGAKFSKNDIKKVYFGNWLRDYSQAMDIAGLSKLSGQAIITILSVLGFMTFGYATEEFQVTEERLGVYLPVEHIDNPKGYAEKEGDARQFHPKLRPPVDRRELEIDENNGMKKYMATENQGWDTSTAHVRRILEACIQQGRAAQGRDCSELWEAYRLLGTGLHTLEDLLAHSNWIEISMKKLGHRDVFCHVGDNVVVRTPNGQAPPLVTGTFGSADFIHSLMGEATDHLSEASLDDLSKKIKDAKAQNSKDNNPLILLKQILSQLPSSGGGANIEQGEQIRQQAFSFDPNTVAPEQVRQRLWDALVWRDGVMRDVSKVIQNIPGLSELVEQLTEALNVYIYTVLDPYITPLLTEATGVLHQGSQAVIESDDQYQVFTDPNASDPSHSLLSKDHFNNILNTPAGKVAIVVVEHTVNLIVEAWSDTSKDPRRVIDQVLEAFHHPYYATGRSQIQQRMTQTLQEWFGGLSREDQREVLNRLSKDSVRNGLNKRLGSDDSGPLHGHSHGANVSGTGGTGGYQSGRAGGGYGSGDQYGRGESAYGSSRDDNKGSYGGSYGGGDSEGYASSKTHGYGSSSRDDRTGSHRDKYGGGESAVYSSTRVDDSGSYTGTHGSGDSYPQKPHGYGSSTREDTSGSYGGNYGGGSGGYSSSQKEHGYGSTRDENSGSTYGGGNSGGGYGDGGYSSTQKAHGYTSTRDDNSGTYGGISTGDSARTQGYRSHEEKPSYGRTHGDSGGYQTSGRDNTTGYGGETSDTYVSKPSRGGYGSFGDGEGGNDDSYGRTSNTGEHGRQAYGASRSGGYREGGNDESYGRPSNTEGYGGQSYGASSGGYGGDETYGVEQLNIGGGHQGHHSQGKHHGKHHQQEDY